MVGGLTHTANNRTPTDMTDGEIGLGLTIEGRTHTGQALEDRYTPNTTNTTNNRPIDGFAPHRMRRPGNKEQRLAGNITQPPGRRCGRQGGVLD